jgi:PhzF family phenazine biosynthesis protein
MTLSMWQVDAFSAKPFGGNPAAIVPLDKWLPDATMQAIANENNLAETAFFVPMSDGRYHLRWFTPESEVQLCGHATLASAWVLFNVLQPSLSKVGFETLSGLLEVERGKDGYLTMSLPSEMPKPFTGPEGFLRALGKSLDMSAPSELHMGRYLMAVWPDADSIRSIVPGGEMVPLLRSVKVWGLIVTGPGDSNGEKGPYDFVSRFFAPDKGVPEDPVTGSAHCALVPFWSQRLGKKELRARQLSPRGGDLVCTDAGERTILSGPCALYMKAEIETGG